MRGLNELPVQETDAVQEQESEEETQFPASIAPRMSSFRPGAEVDPALGRDAVRRAGIPRMPSLSVEGIDGGPASASALLAAARVSVNGPPDILDRPSPHREPVARRIVEGESYTHERGSAGPPEEESSAPAPPTSPPPPDGDDHPPAQSSTQSVQTMAAAGLQHDTALDEDELALAGVVSLSPTQMKLRARIRGIVLAMVAIAAIVAVWNGSRRLAAGWHPSLPPSDQAAPPIGPTFSH